MKELEAIEKAEQALADPAWTYAQGKKLVEMGVKISSGTHLTEAMFKAQGGLIRASLLAHEGLIADLMLSGDFTCLPPEGVDLIAEALIATRLDAEAISAVVAEATERLGIEMPGIAPADIASAIMAAVETGD